MSRNTKIVLGIIGGIVALCCIVAIAVAIFLPRFAQTFVEEAVVENPEEAAAVGDSILQYELPSGFREEGAMSFLGIDMVFINSDTDNSMIMLMAFPESFAGNEEQMQRQMEDTFTEQSGSSGVRFEFTGSQDIVINDMNTTINYFEGEDEDGVALRQATAVFEAEDGGPGMLMIVATASQWERANIDGFVDSLR